MTYTNYSSMLTNVSTTSHKREPLLTESDKRLLVNEISSALNSGVKKAMGSTAETPDLKSMRELVANHYGEVVANQLNPNALKSLYEQVETQMGMLSTNSHQQQGVPDPKEYF
ncbi:hypothetical protein LO977_002442 [Vibrio metschnikovii]|nr:hypothetical protein [Vibrio metschnikovii]